MIDHMMAPSIGPEATIVRVTANDGTYGWGEGYGPAGVGKTKANKEYAELTKKWLSPGKE